MPLALILSLLSALPSILPGVEGLIASITAGVAQRGHFTPDQLKMIDDLMVAINTEAKRLEDLRLHPPA